MGFRETLEHICKQVDGALAASIMGYDGIAIDTLELDVSTLKHPPEVNVVSAMIEYSSIFAQIRIAAEQLEAGEASEFALRTDKVVAVGRAVTSEYFVVLALSPAGNVGKAKYALRIGAGRIAAEL